MNNNIDLQKYAVFVDGVTSVVSKDADVFKARIDELTAAGADVPRLMTSSTGLSSEGGEFSEIVKKIVFHGKDYSPENIFHMKRELGDIIWYWTNACISLGFDPNEVIAENVVKLEARYPGGKFSVWHSENRKPGDL